MLDKTIKLSLKELLSLCLDYPDPLKYPSQILCLSEQINFTNSCESAIKSRTLINFQKEIMVNLNIYLYCMFIYKCINH